MCLVDHSSGHSSNLLPSTVWLAGFFFRVKQIPDIHLGQLTTLLGQNAHYVSSQIANSVKQFDHLHWFSFTQLVMIWLVIFSSKSLLEDAVTEGRKS